MLINIQKDEASETAFFDSSNVLYVKYRDDIKKMAVVYEKGNYYLYHDVPKYIFIRIRDAESQGRKIHELLVKGGKGKKLYKEEKVKALEKEELGLLKEQIKEMKNNKAPK